MRQPGIGMSPAALPRFIAASWPAARWLYVAILGVFGSVAPAIAEPPARLDRYGDPLPPGAVARLGTVRFRCGGALKSMAVSKDGTRLLTVSSDGRLMMSDAVSGRRRELTQGLQEKVSAAAFAPDGQSFVSIAEDTHQSIVIRNSETGRQRLRIRGDESGIACIACSPDGAIVATGSKLNGTITLVSIAAGRITKKFDSHEGSITCLAFSPDGKTLASAGEDGLIRIWNIESGRKVDQIAAKQKQIRCLTFSPSGTLLVSASESVIRLWNAVGGAQVGELTGHAKDVESLAFLRDGKSLVSAGDDGTIRLWDLESKSLRRVVGEKCDSISQIALSNDERTIYVATGLAIRVLDMATGNDITPTHEVEDCVYCLAYSSDGRHLAAGGNERSIRIWDLQSGGWGRREGHEGYVFSVAVSPDLKTVASAGGKPFLRLHPLADEKGCVTVKGPKAIVFCVAFSSDGRLLVSGDGDHHIRVFDVKTERELARFQGEETEVYAVAVSPDCKTIASGGAAHTVHLWDLATHAVTNFPVQESAIHGLAFSPNGRMLASTGDSNTVRLWDVATTRAGLTLSGHEQAVNRIAFSPDGRTVATCSGDGTVRLWEVLTGDERWRFVGHDGDVYGVTFSPDGRRLASSSADTSVLIWDLTAFEAGSQSLCRLTPTDQGRYWNDLADVNAAKAYQAIHALARDPEHSVAFLRERLHPVPRLDEKKIAQLLLDLGDRKYYVRERASYALANLGEPVMPALANLLGETDSLEVRRRAEKLLERRPVIPPGPVLRTVRAIEVLETIGTPAAKQSISSLLSGEPTALETNEAKIALERMARQSATK
jgi:WD40 repeat protein